MPYTHSIGRKALVAVAILASTATLPALASTVVFENMPTFLDGPLTESHHGVGGPILADDFVSTTSGRVTHVEWWGSAATSNLFELAWHTNSTAGQPNVDSVLQGAFLKNASVTAVGVADTPSLANLFHFSADIDGPDISAGVDYWFTVANYSAGWFWALAQNGPTVGTENFNAHRSVGSTPCQDGGPHCGGWVDVHDDNAFRISVVPEPGTMALVALAGLLMLKTGRRSSTATSPAAPTAA
jgi:hypothetical protein